MEQQNMERTKENFDYILRELDYNKDRYDLCGVEITEEDVESVVDLINNGFTEDDAIDVVLDGINSAISEGWEF